MYTDERQIRGMAIIAKGDVPTILSKDEWRIPSQNGGGFYKVWKYLDDYDKYRWACECPDFQYRHHKIGSCKHIHGIQFWLQIRDGKNPQAVREIVMPEPVDDVLECVYCGSRDLRKDGNRKTKHGVKQRLECKVCNRKFTQDAEFGKLSTNPEVLSVVLDLFYKGISTRKISDHLKQFYSMEVDHSTVYRWVIKYTKQIHRFTEQIKPETGRVWNSDEMSVKIGGDNKWQWNMMDKDSRFLIASHISDERPVKEAKKYLKKVRNQISTPPEFLFTDGLQSYIKASKRYLATTHHIRCPSITSVRENNNVVERFHNLVRERDRVIRGYKKDETADTLVNGFNDYYNYIREHQAIGETPAQKAGVSLNLGQNKWHGLLKQAVRK